MNGHASFSHGGGYTRAGLVSADEHAGRCGGGPDAGAEYSLFERHYLAKLTASEDSIMTSQSFRCDNLGMLFLLFGMSVAGVPMAQADGPASGPPTRLPFCHPALPSSRPCQPASGNNHAVPVSPMATKQAEPEEPYGILPEHVTIEQKVEKIRRDMKRRGYPRK